MENQQSTKLAKGAFWASAAFYGLIAFEFFYMFSPFAVYLYAVYGSGLEFIAFSESTSRLIKFFMPHIARDTTSFFISRHEIFGMILFVGGLGAFFVGAIQIYLSKLRKRGAVVKGIYRYIRHPQYLALLISGFGMVLIWPRYLVLFGFILVCFAYFLLARLEEKICLREFPGYDDYMSKTGMFLPRTLELPLYKIPIPETRITKVAAISALFVILTAVSFWVAGLIHSYSVNSLYTWSAPDGVYLSVGRFADEEFRELIDIVDNDADVDAILSAHRTTDNRFINYVMPTDLLISEVPMMIPEGRTPSHLPPHLEDQSRYKIIYTIADFGPADPAQNLEILKRAINKTAVLEVWIDRVNQKVENIIQPPQNDIYFGMPIPLF